MSANIHALPGLYGGGFARVVDVQEIPGTVPPQTGGGGAPALVRLERLSGSATSFHQSLQTFLSAQKTLPTTTAQLSTSAITILQQVADQPPLGPAPQALGPQLPPLGPAPAADPATSRSATTDLAALTSNSGSDAADEADPNNKKDEEEKTSGQKKKGMFDDLFADKAREAKKFGPDPLDVLQKMLETQTSGNAGTTGATASTTAAALATTATTATSGSSTVNGTLVNGTLATGAQSPAYQTALAQQAAQAYAAALAASLSASDTLSA